MNKSMSLWKWHPNIFAGCSGPCLYPQLFGKLRQEDSKLEASLGLHSETSSPGIKKSLNIAIAVKQVSLLSLRYFSLYLRLSLPVAWRMLETRALQISVNSPFAPERREVSRFNKSTHSPKVLCWKHLPKAVQRSKQRGWRWGRETQLQRRSQGWTFYRETKSNRLAWRSCLSLWKATATALSTKLGCD